jgi:hypothetical protein
MDGQDWTPVVVTKTAKQRAVGLSSAQAVAQVGIGRRFTFLIVNFTLSALHHIITPGLNILFVDS